MFDVHQFLFRSDWPVFCSATGLTPETQFSKKNGVNFHHPTIDHFPTRDQLPETSDQEPSSSNQ
jgi:hypothetical protein